MRANPDRRDRRGPLVKEGHLDHLAHKGHKGHLDHKGQQGRAARVRGKIGAASRDALWSSAKTCSHMPG